jgi:diadenosine tetraphosphatase ApaH/serine/threonine PP2A family protein phosphatase
MPAAFKEGMEAMYTRGSVEPIQCKIQAVIFHDPDYHYKVSFETGRDKEIGEQYLQYMPGSREEKDANAKRKAKELLASEQLKKKAEAEADERKKQQEERKKKIEEEAKQFEQAQQLHDEMKKRQQEQLDRRKAERKKNGTQQYTCTFHKDKEEYIFMTPFRSHCGLCHKLEVGGFSNPSVVSNPCEYNYKIPYICMKCSIDCEHCMWCEAIPSRRPIANNNHHYNNLNQNNNFKPERRLDAILQATGLKIGDKRSDEYQKYSELFYRMTRMSNEVETYVTGAGVTLMDKATFVSFANQYHEFIDLKIPSRCWGEIFDLADLDKSSRLSSHEFAVLLKALKTYDAKKDKVPELISLRKQLEQTVGNVRKEISEGKAHIVYDARALVCGKTGTYKGLLDTQAPPGLTHWGSVPISGGAVLNDHFIMDPKMTTSEHESWRGGYAVKRNTEIFNIAREIIDMGRTLADDIHFSVEDVSDNTWKLNGIALAELLQTSNVNEQIRKLTLLAKETERIVSLQPVIVRAEAPVKIFGDIHGQFRDLLMLFSHHGYPSHRSGDVETVSYIFNGDFIDRGAHQLEVLAILFSLKVLYPSRITLIRGNHEFRSQSDMMGKAGFHYHVLNHYKFPKSLASMLYETMHNAFDYFPLGAIVARTVFIVHGGIGDGSWKIQDLEVLKRPIRDVHEKGLPKCVLQALWSDPSDSDDTMARGVHCNPRGPNIPKFGPDVTSSFCDRNNIELVVRSHQFVPSGFKIMHSGKLITIFSARNYFDEYKNDSAIILLAYDEMGSLRVRAKQLQHRVESNVARLQSHPPPKFGGDGESQGRLLPPQPITQGWPNAQPQGRPQIRVAGWGLGNVNEHEQYDDPNKKRKNMFEDRNRGGGRKT